jgi:predicted DNA-binding protein
MYMAQRTQLYLTEEQRARLNERAHRDGVTMASLVRAAIDAYLAGEDDLDSTFGVAPQLVATVPSRDEWERSPG